VWKGVYGEYKEAYSNSKGHIERLFPKCIEGIQNKQ
jgi:hypothetical protein